jgi:hypothetical protein
LNPVEVLLADESRQSPFDLDYFAVILIGVTVALTVYVFRRGAGIGIDPCVLGIF